VEASLAEVELKPANAPASILFPASHGYGLAFTLLLQVFKKFKKNLEGFYGVDNKKVTDQNRRVPV
jgi:hypothetical protein